MKCVKLINNEVYRVSDITAANAVNQLLATYCPKRVWKETGRNYLKKEIKIKEKINAS